MIFTRYHGGKYSAVPNANERNHAPNRPTTVRLTKEAVVMPDVAVGHAQVIEMSEQSAGTDSGVGDGGRYLVGVGQDAKPESVSGDLTISTHVGAASGISATASP